MSLLHFVYIPRLSTELGDYAFPTSNSAFNTKEIDILIEDKTNIQRITYPLIPLQYKYDLDTNLIHVWVYKKDMTPVTSQELSEIMGGYCPAHNGPNLWMEGNISVGEDEEGRIIEMIPELYKIYVEYELDISKIPCYNNPNKVGCYSEQCY